MQEIRFIHCADLHIDSPFKGLSEIHPDLRNLLYQSTFESFNNIVELAIKETVNCVLISGDIYDGADKSLQAQIRFRNGLKQLSDTGIPSFVVYGNHDPLDSWSATLEWPPNVFIFGGNEVECFPLKQNSRVVAYIYGISFSIRDISDNLALKFKPKKDNVPAIGLLHTNVGENTGHEPYAPATVEDLLSRRMDYWALGHVHQHKILTGGNPTIVYPGNSQARNSRETGAKGCCLVKLYSNGDSDIEFVPTDVLRYKSDELNISDCSNVDDVMNSIKTKCQEISNQMDGRHTIIRMSLTGKSDLHSELQKGDNINDLLAQIREFYEGRKPSIWLEKLTLNTQLSYDLESLSKSNNFIADIIRLYDLIEDEGSNDRMEIQNALEPLFSNWAGQKCLEKLSKEELLDLAKESRNWTIDKLVKSE